MRRSFFVSGSGAGREIPRQDRNSIFLRRLTYEADYNFRSSFFRKDICDSAADRVAERRRNGKNRCREIDCLTSFDQVRYREAGIPVEIGFSGKVCPDHFFISNIEDAVKWGVKSGFDMLVTESAGLCNRCSPHISEIPAVCVIDNLSGINTPRKIGPMLKFARLCGNHKRGYRLSGRAGGL